MSIECYESGCKYHPKDEPFCNEAECHYPIIEEKPKMTRLEKMEGFKEFAANIVDIIRNGDANGFSMTFDQATTMLASTYAMFSIDEA